MTNALLALLSAALWVALFCLLLFWMGSGRRARWQLSFAVAAFFAGGLLHMAWMMGILTPLTAGLCLLAGVMAACFTRATDELNAVYSLNLRPKPNIDGTLKSARSELDQAKADLSG